MPKSDAATNIREVAALAADTVLAAKRAAHEMGQSMSSRLDEMKSRSAEALHTGADSVRTGMADAGETVAEKLDAASSYVDACDAASFAGDLRRAVKRYPVGFLIVAAAAGFCAGTVLSRVRAATPQFTKEEL